MLKRASYLAMGVVLLSLAGCEGCLPAPPDARPPDEPPPGEPGPGGPAPGGGTPGGTGPEDPSTWISDWSAAGASRGNSFSPAISEDGSAIAFVSTWPLDPADLSSGPPDDEDVYVWRNGDITWISNDSAAGVQGPSNAPSISDDGSSIAFASVAEFDASDAGSPGPEEDVYAWDETGITWISDDSQLGTQGYSNEPSISGDAVFVAFSSLAGFFDLLDANNSFLDVYRLAR